MRDQRAFETARTSGARRRDVAEDVIGYDLLTQDAMRMVVREALQRAAGPRGLPGEHSFYITFRTRAPGVIMPEHLASRYPDEMTIVLEHQFWDLEVWPDRFRVILKFQGSPHPLTVPFAAVARFYDPSVRFGLQFDAVGAPAALDAGELDEDEVDEAPAVSSGGGGGAVVSLDTFRKK
jgi:hypothetical protein